jgi:hypothetical protein
MKLTEFLKKVEITGPYTVQYVDLSEDFDQLQTLMIN